MKSVFIDTWGWITLAIHSETRHTKVVQFYRDLLINKTKLVTSDYVLSETITLLLKRRHYDESYKFVNGILVAADKQKISIEEISKIRFDELLVCDTQLSKSCGRAELKELVVFVGGAVAELYVQNGVANQSRAC